MSLKHLHSAQLLPKNCIMNSSETAIVPLIDPLSLALPVEGRVSGGALFIEGEDELDGLGVAVVGGGVQQGASCSVDEVVDVREVLFD